LGCEGSAVQICPSRPLIFLTTKGSFGFAQDFACGLPLRSRPQPGSTWGARGRQFKSARPDQSSISPVSALNQPSQPASVCGVFDLTRLHFFRDFQYLPDAVPVAGGTFCL